MTNMTPEEVQAEARRRYEEDYNNALLIAKTTASILGDLLKRMYPDGVPSQERLKHTASVMTIAEVDMLQRYWTREKERLI